MFLPLDRITFPQYEQRTVSVVPLYLLEDLPLPQAHDPTIQIIRRIIISTIPPEIFLLF